MLKKDSTHLFTSILQFGFKEKLVPCTANEIVTETIHYYQTRSGRALALDATNAFDRVEYSQLFRVLLNVVLTHYIQYCVFKGMLMNLFVGNVIIHTLIILMCQMA